MWSSWAWVRTTPRHVLPPRQEVGEVGDDVVHPGHLVVREHEPAVDGQEVVAGLEQHHVEADLAEAAQRDHANGGLDRRVARGPGRQRWPGSARGRSYWAERSTQPRSALKTGPRRHAPGTGTLRPAGARPSTSARRANSSSRASRPGARRRSPRRPGRRRAARLCPGLRPGGRSPASSDAGRRRPGPRRRTRPRRELTRGVDRKTTRITADSTAGGGRNAVGGTTSSEPVTSAQRCQKIDRAP